MYGFSCARHAKNIYFMTLVKFSFQTLKFVTNIKADNIIMCLWFQTAYCGDGQQKTSDRIGGIV